MSRFGWPLLGILGKIGPAAIPALVELLKGKEDERVRVVTTTVLGKIGPEAMTAVPVLTQLLTDNDRLRMAAAWTLGEIGPEARIAIPALTELLQSTDEDFFRKMVVEALQKIKEEEK